MNETGTEDMEDENTKERQRNEDAEGDSSSSSNNKEGEVGAEEGREEEEEGRKARGQHQPKKPSPREVAEHELNHIPYRDWCIHCVKGQGRQCPHITRGGEEEGKEIWTTWAMDYCFLTEDCQLLTKEEVERHGQEKVKDTVMVCEDQASGGVKAHLVQCKGTNDTWIVPRIAQDIEEFGYGRCPIRVKSDQEPAILEIQRALIEKRGEAKTVPINSPVGDSQSNGRVENAIKRVQGMVRTIRHDLEAKLGVKIGRDHPYYPWMIEWAADLLTRYTVRPNGRTPIEEVRGRGSTRGVAKFGEKILYMPAKQSSHPQGKWEDRYTDGVFLGMRMRSDEILIGTPQGVVKARSIKRYPEGEQWDRDFARKIRGSPRTPIPGQGGDHVPTHVPSFCQRTMPEDHNEGEEPAREAEEEEVRREETQVRAEPTERRMYITRAAIQKYGETKGCPACNAIRAERSLVGISHNEECRNRIRKEMEKDEEGKRRLAREDERRRHLWDKANRMEVERDPILRKEEEEHDEQIKAIKARRLERSSEENPEPNSKPEVERNKGKRKAEEGGEMEEKQEHQGRGDEQHATGEEMNRKRKAEDEGREEERKRSGWAESQEAEEERGEKRPGEEQADTEGPEAKSRNTRLLGHWEADISEVYSPPRIAEVGEEQGLKAGSSMDITTKDEFGRPWDFTDVTMRNHAYRRVAMEKPYLLIGSPMCAHWSSIMNLNYAKMSKEKKEELLEKARVHLRFVCQLYKLQHREGRYYLHEHPAGAKSWQEECVRKVRIFTGGEVLLIDQCEYGLMTNAEGGGQLPARKRTAFLTNCPAMALTLSKRCSGRHRHQQLISAGRTRKAQVYPYELCRAVVEAVKLQQSWDKEGRFILCNIEKQEDPQKAQKEMENAVPPEEEDERRYEWEAYDDLSGEALDPEKVMAARKLEMEYFKKHNVFTKVPQEECWRVTGGPPIKSRWIDVDKGEIYRSRWVAKQFRGKDMEEWFAATPPLEAMRAIISSATTGKMTKGLMVNDVSRAFFYAPVQHAIYVELCEEAMEGPEDKGMCAKLNMSMYGTRPAGQNWQKQVQGTMHKLGFKQGKSSSVVFYHEGPDIWALVHGDDFLSSGSPEDLVWMKQQLEAQYEIKSVIIGEAPELEKSVKFLNRTIKWHPGIGVSCEADTKHAQTIIKETGAEKKSAVSTPMVKESTEGEKEKKRDIEEKRRAGRIGAKTEVKGTGKMSPEDATRYRGLVATCNYLAQDRGDLLYAAKELSRKMADPEQEDWAKLERVGRYLKDRPRVKIWFKYQEEPGSLCTRSDTDWAGCRRTRRSTTGGYVSHGGHLLKMWCKTQAIVALSSAEAELYGLVRASAETLGAMSLYKDFGKEVGGNVLGDASAALAIVNRQGIGKIRHLDTSYLWIQEKAANKQLAYQKISGKKNGADLLTKPLSWEEIERNTSRMSQAFEEAVAIESFEGVHKEVVRAARSACEAYGLGPKMQLWQRTDLQTKTLKTTMKGGPPWEKVKARVTIDAKSGEVIKMEKAEEITRASEHGLIHGGPRDVHTILVHR